MRRAIPSALLLVLLATLGLGTHSAKADTNLAITCPSAVEGAGDDPNFANGVFCINQYQQRVTATTKVLSCLPNAPCQMDNANQAWRSFGSLPPGSMVHICGHSVPEGIKDCSLPDNPATFADQKIVPMEQVAQATGASYTADIAWDAPTTNIDGDPLTNEEALTEFRIYSAWNQPITVFTGFDQPHIKLPPDARTWRYAEYGTYPKAGDIFYVSMLACNSGGCSPPTAPAASKPVAGSTTSAPTTTPSITPSVTPPTAPTNLSVKDPIAYKLRQSVDGLSFVAIGTVPLGTACVANNPVADMYRIATRDAITLNSPYDTLPLVVFAKCGS